MRTFALRNAVSAVWLGIFFCFAAVSYADAAHDRKPVILDSLSYARIASKQYQSIVIIETIIEKNPHSPGAQNEKPDAQNSELEDNRVNPYLLTTVLDTRVMGMRHAKMGTGFVYSVINKKRVLIGTNEHIVSGGTEFIVRTALNAEYRARVIEADKERDIAVLEIIPNGKEFADDEFIPIAFGDSQTVSAGEAVIIIGHPREYYYSVQHGVFSATRTIESGREKSFLFSQTDIAVDPGSSGSPLFNIEGKMIGIIALRLKNLSNASFAIPVNDFLKFAEKAKARIAQ